LVGFFFFAWDCCGIGDGMILLDNRDKKTSCQEAKYLIYFYNLDNKLDFLKKSPPIFKFFFFLILKIFLCQGLCKTFQEMFISKFLKPINKSFLCLKTTIRVFNESF